ncbi:hypothetical protein MTO96_036766 [Rhipicephalus appendiculatus]
MEETVDDETINQQDCHSGEWQTVLHAYRNRAPGSNSASKPLSAASVPAEPNASNASAPPDAASATTRTASKEATQLLRTTRAVVQKASNSPRCRQERSGLFFAREAGSSWKSTQQQVYYRHCVPLSMAHCWAICISEYTPRTTPSQWRLQRKQQLWL